MSRGGSGAWAQEHWGPACESAPKRRVAIAPGVNLSVHVKAAEAFQTLAEVLRRHRYTVRPGDTGTYEQPAAGGRAKAGAKATR